MVGAVTPCCRSWRHAMLLPHQHNGFSSLMSECVVSLAAITFSTIHPLEPKDFFFFFLIISPGNNLDEGSLRISAICACLVKTPVSYSLLPAAVESPPPTSPDGIRLSSPIVPCTLCHNRMLTLTDRHGGGQSPVDIAITTFLPSLRDSSKS